MPGMPDYKAKYEELKYRFMSSIDAAWKDGYQHGLHDSQLDQANQVMQQQQMAAEQGAPGGEGAEQEGEAPQEGQQPQGESSQAAAPQEDELGKHIEKLENMLGKAEFSSSDVSELKKTLYDIRSLQTSINLVKSMESAKKIKLKKSSISAGMPKMNKHLPENGQKSLTLQKKIVDSIFQKWEKDSQKAGNDISAILNIDGLTKKD